MVVEEDGTWTIYVTKMAYEAQEIMQPTIKGQVVVWSATDGGFRRRPTFQKSPSTAANRSRSWASRRRRSPTPELKSLVAPGGWRIVFEIDVTNNNLVDAKTVRLRARLG